MVDEAIQWLASILGLTGLALGSTSLPGALCYAAGIPMIIYVVVVRRQAWGLLPLNLAQLVVIGFNIWHAL